MLDHYAYELFLYILKNYLMLVTIIQLLLAFVQYFEWIENIVMKHFCLLRLLLLTSICDFSLFYN